MNRRQKILILEHDNFLKEIIGNLLHKKGGYLLSAFSITEGIKEAQGHMLDTIILGTSCPEYKGKETLAFIKRELNQPQIEFYMINDGTRELDFVKPNQQMLIENLSIQTIINAIPV